MWIFVRFIPRFRELSWFNVKSTPGIATFMEAGWIDPEGACSMSGLARGYDYKDSGPTLMRLTGSGSIDMKQVSTDILWSQKRLKSSFHKDRSWYCGPCVETAPSSESRWFTPNSTTVPGCSARGRATVMEVDASQGSPWNSFSLPQMSCNLDHDSFLLESNSAWLHIRSETNT